MSCLSADYADDKSIRAILALSASVRISMSQV